MSDTPALLQPLETLLNRQLKDNSEARRALRQLHGETLALKLEGLNYDIYFHATDEGLKLGSDYEEDPAAIISGTRSARSHSENLRKASFSPNCQPWSDQSRISVVSLSPVASR